MALSRYYLPESHNFAYIATAPWPQVQYQQDWINRVLSMEDWLEQYVGPHYKRWAWANNSKTTIDQACIAFKYDKHKTLFLLHWN